eukprot:3448096-Prymnesium_polylepis.1
MVPDCGSAHTWSEVTRHDRPTNPPTMNHAARFASLHRTSSVYNSPIAHGAGRPSARTAAPGGLTAR